jgi:excisionase family DNA binding protein
VLLSTTEAAERLGVTDVVLRQWIRAGQLPAYRINAGRGLLRVRESDVDRLLVPVKPGEAS